MPIIWLPLEGDDCRPLLFFHPT